jgi:hypothetical protein
MTVTNEIYWLSLTAAYSLLLVFPYALVRIRRLGFLKFLADPLPGDAPFEQACRVLLGKSGAYTFLYFEHSLHTIHLIFFR